jgi:hypothetical protein
VLTFVAVRVGSVTTRVARDRSLRRRTALLVRGVRWRHVWPAPLLLVAVVTVASTLLLVPGLDWGWWSALGGYGNPVTGGTESTAGTTLEWLLPLAFVLLLLPALPLFAEAEERRFRLGAEHWSWPRRVRSCVTFGLVHALIGIPIGVALALSVGGAWFLRSYLRAWGERRSAIDGLIESTRMHLAYNGTIVALLLVALATGGVA